MAKIRRLVLVVAIALAFSACGRGEPDHRVLFVGNSYTHSNEMPEMVEEIADANGSAIDWAMIAPGGAYLDEHQFNSEVVEAIRSGEYDTVVFQEQSVITSVPELAQTRTLPAARALDSIADGAGVRVVWFQTWGRLNGFPDVGYGDYTSMQAAVSATYNQIGTETGGAVARVGDRWQRTMNAVPVGLYVSDGSHPSPAGSYVAAIEIADAIIDPPIVDAPSVDGVDGDTATALLAA